MKNTADSTIQIARSASIKARPLHRLFFAVMVPPSSAIQIAERFSAFQQRYPFHHMPMSPDRLHVTLASVFAGDCLPEPVIKFARMIGDTIRFEQFPITLDCALTYRNSSTKLPFVFAADAALGRAPVLAAKIWRAHSYLCGNLKDIFPSISPHVTVTWDRVMVPRQKIVPVMIRAEEITLVHSRLGQPKYEILARWALTP